MSNILEGFKAYLERGDDPNLVEGRMGGLFYIYDSIQAWIEEMTYREGKKDLPVRELILNEYRKNPFIAPP